MGEAKRLTELDRARYGGAKSSVGARFSWLLRHAQHSGNPFWKVLLRRMQDRYGLEISYRVQIGEGLYLGHPRNITVNVNSVIGRNCNLNKGCTIGQENRGARKGAPTLGNQVWVGINAVVVGKIVVGDDVLIAPGAYVNCDVPSHSIVLGNPCRIIPRENATAGYIENVV